MDLSIVGLESLSKQNLRFALGYVQSEPKGPVRSGPKGPVRDFSTFGLESLFKQNLKLALAYILGRRACH